VFESGSPNGSIHRTFRAVFDMPMPQSNRNLLKIGKRQYRNPIYLAKEWRRALDSGEYTSQASLARELKVSRARITQILNLLKLAQEVIEIISSLGDPLRIPGVSERRLRPLLRLTAEKQVKQIRILLSVKPNLISTNPK
jgi:hypothetical protein